jgi:hypothetical protein
MADTDLEHREWTPEKERGSHMLRSESVAVSNQKRPCTGRFTKNC